MRRAAAVAALLLILAACGSDDDSTDAGTGSDATETEATTAEGDGETGSADDEADEAEDEEPAADVADAPEIELLGLEIVSIDFETAEVVIANNGDAAVTVDGLWLCNFPSYGELSGVGDVEPGATVTVVSPIDLSAAAGELGVYTSDSFSSPTAIQAYVEWGSADHERASVAAEAGIWDGTPLTVDGTTLTVSG